jgi:hypothetical protein
MEDGTPLLSKESSIGLPGPVKKLEDAAGLTNGLSCVQHESVEK